MKRCSKCGEEKPLAEFNREADRHDGLRPQCKACTRAAQSAYSARTKDRKAAYDRERRAALADTIKAEKRMYYVEHRDAILRRGATRRAACPELTIWKGMIARCTDPEQPVYASYGGRGITVCARWLESFESFLADVGRKPSRAHSIDRINNDGNYEPGNVRWATRVMQARNKRSNKLVTIDGETMPVAAWAERFGVPAHPVYHRLRSGWDPVQAFTGNRSRRPA